MGSEWQEYELGEVAANVSRPFNFEGRDSVVFINTGDVELGKFLHADRSSPIGLPGQAKKKIEKGDILFSEIRPANGRYAEVTFDCDNYVVSTKFMVIRLTKQGIDQRFFLTQLTSQQTLLEFQRIAESRSGTFPQITFDAVSYFPFVFPPLHEQKAIAHILGTLDEKIELNRRMNETLEGMAQALFKSWFVDFAPVIDNALAAGNPIPEEFAARAETRRQAVANGTANREAAKPFPAAFQQTESIGWIPEGWEVGSFLDEAKLLSGGTPKTSESEFWNGEIKWASAKDVSQCGKAFLIETEKTITDLGLNKSSTKIIPKFSTVVVARGATTGRMAMFGEDIAMNQTCYGMRMKSGNHFYGYCHSKNLIANLVSAAHGSVFDTITTTTFESSKVMQVPQSLTNLFEEKAASSFQQILSNQEQTRTLTKLRNTLLPKLISGELRIPAAGQVIEKALA